MRTLLIAILTFMSVSAFAVPNKANPNPVWEHRWVELHPDAMTACYEIAPELNGLNIYFVAKDASHNSVGYIQSAMDFFCPFLLTYDLPERESTSDYTEYTFKSTRAELQQYPLRFKMKYIAAAYALVPTEYNEDTALFNNDYHTIKAQAFLVQLRNTMTERINKALYK